MSKINWDLINFEAPAGTVPATISVTIADLDPSQPAVPVISLPLGTLTTDVTLPAGSYTVTVQEFDAAGLPAGPSAVGALTVGGTGGTVTIQVPSNVTSVP